jgi:hypothetical protein
VDEALMPEGAVLSGQNMEQLAAEATEELLDDATVVETLTDTRERYDISITVKRLELKVEKKVVVKGNGERTVIAASTDKYGPARYRVTWTALATLAVLAGQFAMPLNRMATLFSYAGKRFTAGGLSRLLHYVATRLVSIYIELGEQLSDSEIIGGDDTSCRVLELNTYFEQMKRAQGDAKKNKPPWAAYRTCGDAEESIRRCEEQKRERIQRRAEGDRDAKRTPAEEPTLGMLIGRHFDFESPRQDGQGGKRSINTTVLTGRSMAKDPSSLIIFYRSHLGGCGNLLESILQNRKPSAGDVILQADLSTTNLIRDPETTITAARCIPALPTGTQRSIGCHASPEHRFSTGFSISPTLKRPVWRLRGSWILMPLSPPFRPGYVSALSPIPVASCVPFFASSMLLEEFIGTSHLVS